MAHNNKERKNIQSRGRRATFRPTASPIRALSPLTTRPKDCADSLISHYKKKYSENKEKDYKNILYLPPKKVLKLKFRTAINTPRLIYHRTIQTPIFMHSFLDKFAINFGLNLLATSTANEPCNHPDITCVPRRATITHRKSCSSNGTLDSHLLLQILSVAFQTAKRYSSLRTRVLLQIVAGVQSTKNRFGRVSTNKNYVTIFPNLFSLSSLRLRGTEILC